MKTSDNNMRKTTGLLVMLYNLNKQDPTKKLEEEKALVHIDKTHLHEANLDTPTLINNLQILDNKGYTFTASFQDTNKRLGVLKLNREHTLEQIQKEMGKRPKQTKELSLTIQKIIGDGIGKVTPKTHVFDTDGYYKEEPDLMEIVSFGLRMISDVTLDTRAKVHILPMRDIYRLHKLLSQDTPFEEIQDPGIWYDSNRYEFHVDEEIVRTEYQGKPSAEHFVLKKLFINIKDSFICDYDSLSEFDSLTKEERKKRYRRYKDALLRFIKKHEKLPRIFNVHTDHLEFNKEYIDQTH